MLCLHECMSACRVQKRTGLGVRDGYEPSCECWETSCVHVLSIHSPDGPCDCISCCSYCYNRTLDKNLKREGFIPAHSSGVQSIMAEKSRQQELQTADHSLHRQEAQRDKCLASFLLIYSGTPIHGMVPHTFRISSHLSLI